MYHPDPQYAEVGWLVLLAARYPKVLRTVTTYPLRGLRGDEEERARACPELGASAAPEIRLHTVNSDKLIRLQVLSFYVPRHI